MSRAFLRASPLALVLLFAACAAKEAGMDGKRALKELKTRGIKVHATSAFFAPATEEAFGPGKYHVDFSGVPKIAVEDISLVNRLDSIWGLTFDDTDLSDGMIETVNLREVVWLSLRGTKLSNRGIQAFRGPRVRYLILDKTSASNDVLTGVSPQELLELSLHRTQITDQGMECIATCCRLYKLNLSGTAISDDGLKKIVSLPLRELHLAQTKVTASSVRALSCLGTIETLNLTECKLSNCVAVLDCPKLRKLWVSKTALADRDVMMLVRSACLEDLDLSENPGVTDNSVEHIVEIRTLKKLSVQGTGITEGGLKRIREALPLLHTY